MGQGYAHSQAKPENCSHTCTIPKSDQSNVIKISDAVLRRFLGERTEGELILIVSWSKLNRSF